MTNANIHSGLFIKNRKKVRKDIKSNSVAIIHSNDELIRNGDQHFPYRQNSDFFYLTGLNQEKCILALCPNHPDKKMREVIFTIKPNPLIETWTGHKYTKEEVQEISGIKTVKWIEDFDMTFRDLMINSKTIYFNLNEYQKYQSDVTYIENRFAIKTKSEFPAHKTERLAPILTKHRLVKEPEEIETLKKACDITGSAFGRVLNFVKPCVQEYEVEAEITHEYIKKGARGHAYQPIIGSGKNALVLHYIENKSTCKDGDLLLMDFGAEYLNYAADCSRTIPVNGKFSERQKACYEAVLQVQNEAVKMFTPGNTIDKINKEVAKLMETEMIKLGLFSFKDVKHQDQEQPLYSKYLNYAADCSRTIPVNGKFSERQKACYEAVLQVQNEAVKMFTPGNTIDKINKEVAKLMETEMIKLGLFSFKDVKHQDQEQPLYSKYLMHGVTHFIGLDVHDVGDKFTPFKKGMVLTIEPGIYIEDEGIGIRIENNIIVDDIPVDLMAGIPKEVKEIEGLMKNPTLL